MAFGIQSEFCVLKTCKGALDSGFKVTLLRGAHSTYNTEDKKAVDIESEVEQELVTKGVNVIAWEEWRP